MLKVVAGAGEAPGQLTACAGMTPTQNRAAATAAGAAAGAAIGEKSGGRSGAAIGAAVGAGTASVIIDSQ